MSHTSVFKISVIIPVEPGRSVQPVIDRLKEIRYPPSLMEVMVVEGKSPSHQRNLAVTQASGEIIFFLDSDSLAEPDLFEQTVPLFREDRVAIVGGPNVSPKSASRIQKAFDAVQTSLFGSYTVRARYQPVGVQRDTTEKELILCNMAMRKSVFVEMNGFDTRLFPNEENELMNRIRSHGYRLVYQPSALVYRHRRDALQKFIRQNFTYGRGRMEQMWVGFYLTDLVHLVPAGLVAYLVTLPWLGGGWFEWPWWAYVGGCLGFGAFDSFRVHQPVLLPVIPFLFAIRHLSYGLGLWAGLGRKLAGVSRPPVSEPVLRWVKKFGEAWT